MVSSNPKYRNTRELYYTDKQTDSQSIGTIVQVLKSTTNSFDHSSIPTLVENNNYGGSTAYDEAAWMQNLNLILNISILLLSIVMVQNIIL